MRSMSSGGTEIPETEEHDLVVIERDPKKVARLQSSIDILAVAGDGCNPVILKAHRGGDLPAFCKAIIGALTE